jgi:hypothetical protein
MLPNIPIEPTIYPSLKKRITPMMLRKVGIKTPLKEPNVLEPVVGYIKNLFLI